MSHTHWSDDPVFWDFSDHLPVYCDWSDDLTLHLMGQTAQLVVTALIDSMTRSVVISRMTPLCSDWSDDHTLLYN